MANREALRELQARLADRLQQARTEVRAVSWLAIECAGAALLVPLHTAGEIFSLVPLLPVPHTNDWFIGVANLRGRLHGVVDLGAFLGLRSTLPRDALREQGRLLSFNARQGSHCAIFVDRLAGLRSAEQLKAVPASTGPRPPFVGGCWIDADGREWQEIDLSVLARSEQFLAIAA